MKEFVKDVSSWIHEFVSVHNKTLGHTPCPFAKQALIDDKIMWHTAQSIDDLEKLTIWLSNRDLWGNKEVLIIGMEEHTIRPKDLYREIEKINRVILMPNGLVALEDHPTSVEIVNGAKMNQGKWILVLIQSIDKLNRASEILKKQGYYDNWSQENLAEVVNWRTETTF
jgi:hypothetical protein